MNAELLDMLILATGTFILLEKQHCDISFTFFINVNKMLKLEFVKKPGRLYDYIT